MNKRRVKKALKKVMAALSQDGKKQPPLTRGERKGNRPIVERPAAGDTAWGAWPNHPPPAKE
ncbi:MAG: hypothetical protein ACRDGM_18570 [bacterium]